MTNDSNSVLRVLLIPLSYVSGMSEQVDVLKGLMAQHVPSPGSPRTTTSLGVLGSFYWSIWMLHHLQDLRNLTRYESSIRTAMRPASSAVCT